MNSDRLVRQFLHLLKSSGVSHLPRVRLQPKAPVTGVRRSMTSRAAAAPTTTSRQQTPQRTPAAPAEKVSLAPVAPQVPKRLKEVNELLSQSFSTPEARQTGLCQLAEIVANCRRCTELAETRRQTVFGVGDPNARIMFIGEAPGGDEDRQGEPFVGAAGQLLNRIIQAMGLTREEIYICNVLRCRPPGNRTPLPQEAANCREFLDGQIRIVNPDYIICWGTVAAQNLLGNTTPVGKLRGRFYRHGRARVLCTYHPSYLLRTASAKKLVWDDMKMFLAEMETDDDSYDSSAIT
ncbi:MAG: uracil-DNA glycosylase [Planctomycetaceae bacterium]|nr:uracil-DNA glycosylase [Planctomycetaceae bacterium]